MVQTVYICWHLLTFINDWSVSAQYMLYYLKLRLLVTLLFVFSLVNGRINLGMGGQYCWESTSTGNKYSCRFGLIKHHKTASIAGYVYLAPAVQSNSYHIPSLELVVAKYIAKILTFYGICCQQS